MTLFPTHPNSAQTHFLVSKVNSAQMNFLDAQKMGYFEYLNCGSHKRDIMSSNVLTYTNGPFSYLKRIGSDYETISLC